MKNKADWVCLLSGGQDSAVCLYWAKKHLGPKGLALNFDYGQEHKIECSAAAEIAVTAQVNYRLVELNLPSESSLISGTTDKDIDDEGYLGMPSVVPGRNLLFGIQAAMVAFKWNAYHLILGVGQTNQFGGYPDCRRETIISLQQTIQLGMEYPLVIHTPLMNLSKAQIIELGYEVGLPNKVLAKTVTCFRGNPKKCPGCLSCRVRAKGFAKLNISDPALA